MANPSVVPILESDSDLTMLVESLKSDEYLEGIEDHKMLSKMNDGLDAFYKSAGTYKGRKHKAEIESNIYLAKALIQFELLSRKVMALDRQPVDNFSDINSIMMELAAILQSFEIEAFSLKFVPIENRTPGTESKVKLDTKIDELKNKLRSKVSELISVELNAIEVNINPNQSFEEQMEYLTKLREGVDRTTDVVSNVGAYSGDVKKNIERKMQEILNAQVQLFNAQIPKIDELLIEDESIEKQLLELSKLRVLVDETISKNKNSKDIQETKAMLETSIKALKETQFVRSKKNEMEKSFEETREKISSLMPNENDSVETLNSKKEALLKIKDQLVVSFGDARRLCLDDEFKKQSDELSRVVDGSIDQANKIKLVSTIKQDEVSIRMLKQRVENASIAEMTPDEIRKLFLEYSEVYASNDSAYSGNIDSDTRKQLNEMKATLAVVREDIDEKVDGLLDEAKGKDDNLFATLLILCLKNNDSKSYGYFIALDIVRSQKFFAEQLQTLSQEDVWRFLETDCSRESTIKAMQGKNGSMVNKAIINRLLNGDGSIEQRAYGEEKTKSLNDPVIQQIFEKYELQKKNQTSLLKTVTQRILGREKPTNQQPRVKANSLPPSLERKSSFSKLSRNRSASDPSSSKASPQSQTSRAGLFRSATAKFINFSSSLDARSSKETSAALLEAAKKLESERKAVPPSSSSSVEKNDIDPKSVSLESNVESAQETISDVQEVLDNSEEVVDV